MSILRKIQKVLCGKVAKAVLATMIGVATVFGTIHTSTQAMIIEPPRIEMSYTREYDGNEIEVVVVDSEDDIPEEARKNHTQIVTAPSKDSVWDKVKGWVRHPIKSVDDKLSDVKKDIREDFKNYSDETRKAIEDNINARVEKGKSDMFESMVESVSQMFQFVIQGIIILPVDLVTNESLRNLYFKLLVIAVSLTAVFAVYNCLLAIVDEENYIGFSFMIGNIFKSILLMMSSVIYIPLLVLLTNRLAQGILSLVMEQVEMNVFLRMVMGNTLFSIAGFVGSIIVSAMLLLFLLLIFLHTCSRYWEICKIFAMAPLAYALSIVPSESHIYISWKNKLKHILFIQILYALHITVFMTILSVPNFSPTIKLMLFIGGIWDLTKLPTGLDDIFRSNQNKTMGVGKQIITSLVAKKIPVVGKIKK